MDRDVIVLRPGEGRAYEWGAMRGVFKADGKETGDAYSVSEWTGLARTAIPRTSSSSW